MRNVIFSHNLFKEGLEAFHPEAGKALYSQQKTIFGAETRLYGYVLFDFKLTKDWNFDGFVVERSIEVCHYVHDSNGQDYIKSFVSPVLLPRWVKKYNGHLYLQGLAAVLSFGLGRPVFSPRNDWLIQETEHVDLQSFFHDNASNLDAIENIKVVIKTKEGNELEGRFQNPRAFSSQGATGVKWSVSVNFEGGAFIAFFLDKEGNIKSTQEHKDVAIDIATVIKLPDLREFAMLNAITVLGPGNPIHDVHPDILGKWKRELDDIFDILFKLKYEADDKELDYKKSIQAMRLIQLAHQNHREDFDLSFALLVAAVEAIAQIAISKDRIHDLSSEKDAELAALAENHPDHKRWNKTIAKDEATASFFEHYSKLLWYVKTKAKPSNLAKRFEAFILEYCPVEDWDIIDRDTMREGYAGDDSSQTFYDQFRQRELKPTDLNESELSTIIKKTYSYRSGFFHAGEATPHNWPESTPTDRFFETVCNEEEWGKLMAKLAKEGRNQFTHEESEKTKIYLISHTLMAMLAKKSIYKFLMNMRNLKT